jgi:asparagine synthase (glutamine-hydrolysing)
VCGICGFVGREDVGLARAMAQSLAHRGPDGEGVQAFPARDGLPPATLGHRRLSIIDPTPRGAQPMQRGRFWISYNGEIYNYRELRAELESAGATFASDSDTEVLLALYEHHGEAMLPRLNGIYALAIWDSERHELLLARDRLGVKPIYYALHDGMLVFASEPKALLHAIPKPGLRLSALADFLTFLWVPEPDTLFEGISKLPGGHLARFRGGRLEIEQWWDLDFAHEERPDDAWIGDVRDEVGEAVRRQMVSDVPLGAFLSGGVDSSAIVAEMATTGEKVTAYSIGSPASDLAHEPSGDDLKYARVMARQFDVDYHEQLVEPVVEDLLPRLARHLDDPVADTATITTYLICSAARERLTVILSGMGGDEVFAGYPRYLALRLSRALDVAPAGLRSRLREASNRHLTLGRPGRLRGPRRNLRKLLGGIDGSWQDRYLAYSTYYRREELMGVLAPDVRAALADHDPLRHHRRHFEHVASEHWLNQLLYVDAKTFLPCLNLAYTDKLSMAASTEVRVPLLDDEVVALAARIPPRLKLRRLTRKYVFKKSMEGVLPREIVWRPKAGFGGPVRAWMGKGARARPLLDDALAPGQLQARGLFDPAAIEGLVARNDAGQEDNALRLWTLLTLELWQREFMDAA